MFKYLAFIAIIYMYYSNMNCNEIIEKKNNSHSISLLLAKVNTNEILSDNEINRLNNYIDYKINKWNDIKNKLDKYK
jgi:hypothetical protein